VNDAHLQVCASPEWRKIVEEHILPDTLQGVDLGDEVLEIGPGPGLTTDVLMTLTERLTVVEVDADLAESLAKRMSGSNVTVHVGDATSLDFPDDTFSAGASFHMLHHVEKSDDQDRIFSELARVIKDGGVLVAADGVRNEGSQAFHEGDIYNPIEADDLDSRLARAGFSQIDVRLHDYGWFCTAVAPA
jgi:SAM-dependent methyltransferase